MFTVSRSRRLVTSTNVHTVARPVTVTCTDVLFSCGDKRMGRGMIGKGVITRLTTQVGLPFSAIFAFFPLLRYSSLRHLLSLMCQPEVYQLSKQRNLFSRCWKNVNIKRLVCKQCLSLYATKQFILSFSIGRTGGEGWHLERLQLLHPLWLITCSSSLFTHSKKEYMIIKFLCWKPSAVDFKTCHLLFSLQNTVPDHIHLWKQKKYICKI